MSYQNLQAQQNAQKHLDQWEPAFKTRTKNFTHGPVEERKCKDICCLVTFVAMMGAFIGVGAWCIQKTVETVNSDIIIIDNDAIFGDPDQLKQFIFSVVGLSMLSLVMCTLFVFLTRVNPKCMVYGVIIFVSLLFVAAAGVFLYIGLPYLSIIILIVMALYLGLIFYCFKKHLKTAIVLVKITGTFLTEKPIIYTIPLLISIITFLFAILWVGSFTGLIIIGSADPPQISINTLYSLYVTQGFIYTFTTFFTYYIVVFLIASAVAVWYYQVPNKSICAGFGWMFKGHIGSLTFAALVITIIKMLKEKAKKGSKGNSCVALMRACCVCLLAILEKFIKVMNRLAVIIMAFTGEDYITACKSTGVIVYNNLAVFTIITIITNFFYWSGMLTCIGIPTAIAGFIVDNIDFPEPALPVVLVFLCSGLISNIFLTAFTETLTSIFVFYCLDLQLQEYGIKIVNHPSDIQILLEHAFDDSEDYRESFVEKTKQARAGNVISTDPLDNMAYQEPVQPVQPTRAQPVYAAPPQPPPYAYQPPAHAYPPYQQPPPQHYPGYQPPPAGYYQPPPHQNQPNYYPPPPPPPA